MTDAYLTISEIAASGSMASRVSACAASEGMTSGVEMWTTSHRWEWAATPSWAEKWDYAVETHPDEEDYDPGADDTVITDADILSAIQPMVNPGQGQ